MSKRPPLNQTLWQPWIDHVCAAAGVDPSRVDVQAVHDLTGHVAEVFERPMAPVAAHLWALTQGAGGVPAPTKAVLKQAASDAGERGRLAAEGAAFDAVIVAGGKGSRMGYVSKADLVVSGRRLLDVVLEATQGARTTVVVGDTAVPDGVLLTREEPAGTGPAAGLVAGLDAIDDPAPWVLVLACDLPDAPAAAWRLRGMLPEAPEDADGLSLRDTDGRLQHLASIYRSETLRRAARAYGNPANRSVRGLVTHLHLHPVDPGHASLQDLDTPQQLADWVAAHPHAQKDEQPSWREFINDACVRLGLPSTIVNEGAVLDQSRMVSRSGARPMSPVAPYIWGLALSTTSADPALLLDAINEAVKTAPQPE